MKEKYLEELKVLLTQYDITNEELEDILADYGEMIDDAKSKNMTDDKIIELIGSPKKVVGDLSESYQLKDDSELVYEYHHGRGNGRRKSKDNRIVALMPFIATITFFILGFAFDAWHPGWMVYLLIPVSAIVVNVFEKGSSKGMIAVSPFIALVTFFILGFAFDLWHPGWLVFLIIPVIAIVSHAKDMKLLPFLTALSPFFSIVCFILYGTYVGDWHLAWLVFLSIPILGGLQSDKVWKIFAIELSILFAIGAYIYIGYTFEEWTQALWVFLVPLGVGILTGDVDVKVSLATNGSKTMMFMSLAFIAIYIGSGILFKSWAYLWMIFLFVPMYAIVMNANEKDKLVALMPFISTILFFSLGFFFQFWTFSWIAFLLIPMVAIIKNA